MKHVFIIGSKGIPAKYGGFETFVHKLTEYKVSNDIQYHVSCMADNEDEFYFNNARCFNVKVPNIGPAKAVIYDVLAMKKVLEYVKANNIKGAILYILACRIGPFLSKYKKMLEEADIKIYINPDGHEWKRSKWNVLIRQYWKFSERLMVKNAHLLICDSKGIEQYIRTDYLMYDPKTTFIAYGADVEVGAIDKADEKRFKDWLKSKNVKTSEYYLIVGRFVPENNYELIIREFMKSSSKKDLVIITNHEGNSYCDKLKKTTNFESDSRVKFVGTVYDEKVLRLIRTNAFGYLHGHEVGGTNPSLLEALSTTPINLLLDVIFNKEVAEEGALYFNKEKGNLASLIGRVEDFNDIEISTYEKEAKRRIQEFYSWDYIVNKYETLFITNEEC